MHFFHVNKKNEKVWQIGYVYVHCVPSDFQSRNSLVFIVFICLVNWCDYNRHVVFFFFYFFVRLCPLSYAINDDLWLEEATIYIRSSIAWVQHVVKVVFSVNSTYLRAYRGCIAYYAVGRHIYIYNKKTSTKLKRKRSSGIPRMVLLKKKVYYIPTCYYEF